MSGDMNFRFGKPDRPGAARSPRRRMAFRGTFETVTEKGTVEVMNISTTGTMIQGESVPAAGRDIVLTAQGMEFFGRIVWSDGCRCGIEFDEPLAQAQVLELHRITAEQVRSEEIEAGVHWRNAKHRFDY